MNAGLRAEMPAKYGGTILVVMPERISESDLARVRFMLAVLDTDDGSIVEHDSSETGLWREPWPMAKTEEPAP